MDNNDEDYWDIPDNIDRESFDFDWEPPFMEGPHTYQFPTKWDKNSGPRYVCAGSRGIRYTSEQVATTIPDMSKWLIDPDIDTIDFDFTWLPHYEPQYKFVFKHGVVYDGGNEGIKYVNYPIPKVTHKPRQPLDIVYVSNGEVGEEERYNRIQTLAGRPVKWVRGVAGRENALREAARICDTSWFILFPAKLWADDQFDFNYQPPNKALPQHYIFYARNPVNGLEYGHQAAVCYNRDLVLDTHDYGLDFTMSKPHAVVPVISGVAQYNSDLMMTWRTAFREAVKLTAAGDAESLERLRVWLREGRGLYCAWSVIGAEDGVEYYKSVNGDHAELMKTFEWRWLSEHFAKIHPNLATTSS
jgi:hypothetical protein